MTSSYFPLLQRLALPVTIGAVRYPGIKIHNTRIIRLLEVLLQGETDSSRRPHPPSASRARIAAMRRQAWPSP